MLYDQILLLLRTLIGTEVMDHLFGSGDVNASSLLGSAAVGEETVAAVVAVYARYETIGVIVHPGRVAGVEIGSALDAPVERIIVVLYLVGIYLRHEQIVEKFQTVGTVGVDTERVEIFCRMYQRGAAVGIDRSGESYRITLVLGCNHIVDTSCQCAT